jgi:hypothetical protein
VIARDQNGLPFEAKLVLVGPRGDVYIRACALDDEERKGWRDPSDPEDVVFTTFNDDVPRLLGVGAEWYCDGCEPAGTNVEDDDVLLVEPGRNDYGFIGFPECTRCGHVHDWVDADVAAEIEDGAS